MRWGGKISQAWDLRRHTGKCGLWGDVASVRGSREYYQGDQEVSGCIGCWLWGSHSQQCLGGPSLLGSLLDQQDHPSPGPLGDQDHPEMTGGVIHHNLSRDLWPLRSTLVQSLQLPALPPTPLCWPLTDLGPFLSSCSRQSLLARRSWGARVTSLPHGTAFPSCSLGKAV